MTFEFIPVRLNRAPTPVVTQLVGALRNASDRLDLGKTVVYHGWPRFTDYEAVRHQVDLAIVSEKVGVVLIRIINDSASKHINDVSDSISQAAASAVSQLVRSPVLRNKSRQLKISVVPALYVLGHSGGSSSDVDIISSEAGLTRYVEQLDRHTLTDQEFQEARSILEGAKALVRPTKRHITDPAHQKFAASLSKLEEEIASFDQRQRQVALTSLGSPQRIRGLAGSGKTVILAMKAALAHLENPDATILLTFYTRSLRDQITRLITRFHRHFGEGEPDWSKVHIRHGWGRKDLPGVYREACLRAGISPMTFSTAAAATSPGQEPFDYVCRHLIATGRVSPHYDLILIDEGQDFPSGFYELCFHMAKGFRDHKQIVWAYDELQNVFDVKVRTPEDLFGTDDDGEPRISLARSLPPHAETNDFVLPKCYRNQRDVLVLAHAVGFGVYGQAVQMLQDREHWEDVGYQVLSPSMTPGSPVVIRRPNENSPTQLETPDSVALVDAVVLPSMSHEVDYIANEFKRFIDGGLQPEDLMAIAADDRRAQGYLSALSEALALRGISSNNIIADRYSEPSFMIEGKCTLSTVYRAKGNEAAVVAVLGCDAVPLTTRSGRNRLFTAFTRTKGWLRITGMGHNFEPLHREIQRALGLAPDMQFFMPDPKQIELIQRDLSDKDARIQRARAEMDKLKDSLGLSEEDLKAVFAERGSNGRA